RARSGSRISPSSTESRTAPSPSAAANTSPCVFKASICCLIRLAWYLPRYKNPPARSASAKTLTARMRRVSGETGHRLPLPLGRTSMFEPGPREALPVDRRVVAVGSATSAGGRAGAAAGSTVAVSIPDAIEGFNLGEVGVYGLELLAQPLDVAVDRLIGGGYVVTIGRLPPLGAGF